MLQSKNREATTLQLMRQAAGSRPTLGAPCGVKKALRYECTADGKVLTLHKQTGRQGPREHGAVTDKAGISSKARLVGELLYITYPFHTPGREIERFCFLASMKTPLMRL